MTKKRKISTVSVLMPLMLILAMFMMTGCDWLFEDGPSTTSLKLTIAEARGLLNSTVTSEDGSGVSVGVYWAKSADKSNLQSAVTIADSVLLTATAQDDVDNAERVLKTAISQFRLLRTLKQREEEKVGEITGTITLKDIPATGRPKVSIRAGIDAAGISYDSEISEISLSGVPGNQTQAELNWSIPVYENEEIPPRARFRLMITPQGTTSSLYIDIYDPIQGSEIDIPENHVVGNLGTYSIGTIVLSGTIDVKHNGTLVPYVEMSASSAIEREPLGGFTILSSPGTNSPWTMVLSSSYASIGMVLNITGYDDSWNILFETTFSSDSLKNVSSNVSGININLGDVAEGDSGKTITITNIPESYYDMYYIYVGLIYSKDDLNSEAPPLAYGYGVVDNLSMTLELFTSITEEPWTGTGSYYAVVNFSQYGPPSNFYITKNQVSFATNPTVNFSTDFDEFYPGGEGSLSDLFGTWRKGDYQIYIDESVFVFSLVSTEDEESFDIISYEGTALTIGYSSYTFTFDAYIDVYDNLVIEGSGDVLDLDFDGLYTKVDFINPDDAILLIEDIWTSGYLSNSEPEKWFYFEVEKDTDYEIFINDLDWNDNKADVVIDIILNEKILYKKLDIYESYEYGDNGKFYAPFDGTIYVRVYSIYGNGTGSFDIGYNTSGNRANLEWPLKDYTWKSGNFDHSDVVYFSFQAEAGKTYNIWWDDYDQYSTRIDVMVSVYLITSTSTECLFESEDVSTNDISVTGPGYVLIEVIPLDNDGEDFEVAFSTDGTRPDK